MAITLMLLLAHTFHFKGLHGQETCHRPSVAIGSSFLQSGKARERLVASSPDSFSDPPSYILQEISETLDRSRQYSLRPSTPILFSTMASTPDAGAYSAAVAGQCCNVLNCADASGLGTPDCTPDPDYMCNTNSEEAVVDGDGNLVMSFRGTVMGDHVTCPTCEICMKYKTCAGPSAESETAALVAGECVRWEFTSSAKIDDYEVYMGLYNDQNELIANVFERGAQQDWKYMQVVAPADTTAHMKFMLASYDATGGKALGADMQARNLVHGHCLPDECLKVSPERCCYTGKSAPLSEAGYFVIAECDCNEEMEEFITRVAAEQGLEFCLDSGLFGLVPWFTREHSLQSLAILQATLNEIATGTKSPECPFLAATGHCPSKLPDECFADRPIDPASHRRRVCQRK